MSMMTWASVNEECETTEIAPETDTVHFTDATVKRVDWSWKTVQAKYLASQYSHRHQQSSSIRSSRELAFPPPTELSVAWPNINPKLNDTTPGSRLASRVSSVIRRAHLAFKSHKLPTEKTLINGQTPKQLFRRVAHIIARMVDVCYRMKMYAVEAGLVDRYLVPISMQAPRGKKQEGEEKATGKKKKVKEESFVFDLDYFLINKKNDMPKPVTLLMEKNPDERTEHDLELIGREVWKIPSFRKYSSRLQRMMCRIVRYMKCGKRRVVLRKGHIGYNVYYIYSGSVNVLLEKDDTGIFVKPEVVVLKKGACFGEIALLENTRRNATIVCAEPTEFIVIDKEDYVKNGLSDQMKEETRMRFEFFRNWKPLAQWSDTAIHALSYISRTEDFVYNRVIVADSQRNEWLWFIAKGNGELLRFIDLEKCTNPLLLEDLENKGFQFLNTSRPNDPPGVDRRKIASEKKNDVVPGITLTKPGQMVDPAWQGMPALLFGKKDRKRLVSLKKQQLAIGQKGESTDGTPAPDLKKPTPGGAGKGIYLRIDTLVQGQCMGLESLFPETDVGRRHAQQRYSLVSQGCTVIHLPRVKFRAMATPESLHHISLLLSEDYPHDKELGEKFITKSTWEIYKHGVVEALVRKKCKTCPSIENYLRFDAVRNIEHICYTPADNKDWPDESIHAPPVPGMIAQQWQAPPSEKKGLIHPAGSKEHPTSALQVRCRTKTSAEKLMAKSSSAIQRSVDVLAAPLRRTSVQSRPGDHAYGVLAVQAAVAKATAASDGPVFRRIHVDRQVVTRDVENTRVVPVLRPRLPSTFDESDPTSIQHKRTPIREVRHVRLSQIIDLKRMLARRRERAALMAPMADEAGITMLESSNVNHNSNRSVGAPKPTFATSPDDLHLPRTVRS